MIKTVELKTAVYNLIQAVVTAYESGHVSKDAKFPYATYQLQDSTEGDTDSTDSLQYPVEIEIYDHRKDKNTDRIEDLADAVDAAMNRVNHIDNRFYFYAIRESRNPNLPTPDEYTFRRNLRYTLKVYAKESEQI